MNQVCGHLLDSVHFLKLLDIESKPKSIFISMNPTEPLALDQLFLLE